MASRINSTIIFRESDDEDTRNDTSDLSDDETSRPLKPEITPISAENENTDVLETQLINHDWSFLSTILPDQENMTH